LIPFSPVPVERLVPQSGPADNNPVEGAKEMRDRVLPVYVVCDESYSMTDHMDALNTGLRELHRCVRDDPATNARVRLCLIGFADTARVVVPLSPLGDVPDIGALAARASTNYGVAFTLLRETIERDVADLSARSCPMYRPTVFFLSDGQPTDEALWRRAHSRLVDRDWPARPRIVAFGVGDVDATTMRAVGDFKAYLHDGTATTIDDAVGSFARTLTDSLVLHGTGDPSPRLPDHVTGFTDVSGEPR
jgi:uncharacterized protein YegL